MISLTITDDFKTIIKRIKNVDINVFAVFLTDLADKLNDSIKQRVQKKGNDINLHRMKPYATKYGQRKKNRGLNSKFRDLTFTGKMFSSLTKKKAGSKKVYMFFRKDNIAFFNQKKTPFFGISSKEEKIIDNELKLKDFI